MRSQEEPGEARGSKEKQRRSGGARERKATRSESDEP